MSDFESAYLSHQIELTFAKEFEMNPPIFRMELPVVLLVCLSSQLSGQSTADYGQIASKVADKLQYDHVSRHPFDDEISLRIFDSYLSRLDPDRVLFLQQDVNTLRSQYGDELDDQILLEDVSAAKTIHKIYVDRVNQWANHLLAELKNKDYDFSSDRIYHSRDSNSPYPADQDGAKKLWEEWLEYRLLELALIDADLGDLSKPRDPSAIKVSSLHRERLKHEMEARRDRVRETFSESLYSGLIKSIAKAYDSNSEYYSKTEYDAQKAASDDSEVGVGLLLQSKWGGVFVNGIIKEGPASGVIQVGDRIRSIQGIYQRYQDVDGMELSEVVKLLRGAPGSIVRLKVTPGNDPTFLTTKEVELVREETASVESVARAELILSNLGSHECRIGWIELNSFYSQTQQIGTTLEWETIASATQDVDKLLSRLVDEKIDGLVLDLRGNGGGALQEGIDFSGLFLRDGPVVVQTKDDRERIEQKRPTTTIPTYGGPLLVLTSPKSAGASEIVAGALQDYGRAVIVGGPTFGLGTIGQLHPIETGRFNLLGTTTDSKIAALKISVGKYYRITGFGFQNRGVIPGIVLSENASQSFGEDSKSLSPGYDEIEPVKIISNPSEIEYPLPQLQNRSQARLKRSLEFTQMNEMDSIRNVQRSKTILNATQRIRDYEEYLQKVKQWSTERRREHRMERSTNETLLERYNLPLNLPNGAKLPRIQDFVPISNYGSLIETRSDMEVNYEEPFDPKTGVSPDEREALEIMVDIIKLSGLN